MHSNLYFRVPNGEMSQVPGIHGKEPPLGSSRTMAPPFTPCLHSNKLNIFLGSGSAEKSNPDPAPAPAPDPTLIRNEKKYLYILMKKNIYIF